MLYFAIIIILLIINCFNSTLSHDCCDNDEIYMYINFNRFDEYYRYKYSDLEGKYIKQGMFNERPYYRKTCTLKDTSRRYYFIYYQKRTSDFYHEGNLITHVLVL